MKKIVLIFIVIFLISVVAIAAEISQITFIEQGDTNFSVSFMFNDHNLQTRALPRTTSKAEVIAELRQTVLDWQTKRAESNFSYLKTELEGKTINIQ